MTPHQLAGSNTEAGNQRALFAWAACAERYGIQVASEDLSYKKEGYAEHQFAVAINYYGNSLPNKYLPLHQIHWLHAIKNAEKGGIKRGAMAKAEGVKPGVADCFLPWPTTYAGLYLEMKRPGSVGNKQGFASELQKEFRLHCLAVGYQHFYCFNWFEARDHIITYLGFELLPPASPMAIAT